MQQNFCWLDCRIRYKPFKKKCIHNIYPYTKNLQNCKPNKKHKSNLLWMDECHERAWKKNEAIIEEERRCGAMSIEGES